MNRAPDAAGPAERPGIVLPTALVVATLAVYAVCSGYGYTGWDDEAYITVNPMLESGAGLIEMWTTDRLEQYYPLTFTCFWLEYRLWGKDPAGYHVVNVLVHALNVFLVLVLLLRLGATRTVAGFTAAFFAFHPLQAMSVAWIAERKNLLSLTFGLLSLLAWHRYRACDRKSWYLLALAAFAFALMSKTAILGLPFLFLLLDAAFLGRPLRASVPPVVTFLLLGAGFALVTIEFEAKFLGTMPAPAIRPLIAAAGVWFYLGKILVPTGLLPIYPLWPVSLGDPLWWLPLVALGLAAIGLWVWRRFLDRWTLFGVLVFFLFLGPTSGLFAFGNLTVTYVSDHYVYVPLIGVCVALLVPLDRWMRRRSGRQKVVTALLGLLVAVHVALTLRYLPAYDDARTMWTHTLEGNPDAFPAHMGLGILAKKEGNWPRAAQHFWKAWRTLPEETEARYELADALLRSGDLDLARREFLALAEQEPAASRPHYGLAVLAERERRFEAAIASFREGLELAEDDARRAYGHAAVGRIQLGLGRPGLAEASLREALRYDADDALVLTGLAAAQRGTGEEESALATLEGVIENDAEAVAALVLLARILATSGDPALRDGPRAVELAERARRLAPAGDLPPVEALAAARAESGDFTGAAALLEEAARATGLKRLRRQAAAYRSGKPLREGPAAPR